jgi:hypothetical protein
MAMELHLFLISTLDGGEWAPASLLPKNSHCYPTDRRLTVIARRIIAAPVGNLHDVTYMQKKYVL